MIIAPPRHWLLQIDFSVLELRTLAQICLRRFGRSKLADLFQQGIDPHRFTAALLLGLSLAQFEQLPAAEQKQHRQRAKAINFGVPGGLGAASLVSYAKHSYGVQLSIDEARQFRQRLIEQIYPELAAYLQDNQHRTLAFNLHTSESLARQALPRREQLQTAQRIISGCESAPAGEAYQPELIEHVWLILRQLNRNADLMADLVAKQGSSELMRRCFYQTTATLSGRLRGHVNFSQAANSPFQGLAADGNKLALFRLLRAGYQVCAFIHDEMLILLPDGADYSAAVQQVQQILIDAMQELTPDIPISCEYLLADRWYKDAPAQATDAAGRILPYRKPIEQRRINTDPDTIWSFCDPPQELLQAAAADLIETERPQPKKEATASPVTHDRQPDRCSVPAQNSPQAQPVSIRAEPAEQPQPQQAMQQPLKWHGGKRYLARRIIELMPAHTHYVEPFAGGLSVLLQKNPQGISEVVNDLNGELTNFYRVLQQPEQFEQLYRQLEVTPLSQAEFEQAMQASDPDPVQAAAAFYIRMRQSRQGIGRDFATLSRNRTRRGMNEQVSAWLAAVAGLPQIHQRLRRVVVCNCDAVKLIRKQDGKHTLFYCDPPYLFETRSSTGEYACEMTDEQHQQLLDCLAAIKGKFLLSGYPSELYSQYAQQHGWSCVQIEIDNKASSAKQKQKKTECIWMNYQGTSNATD